MKTYEIPSENLAKLELRINALARKAVKLELPEPELEIVGERMIEIVVAAGLPTGKLRKVYEVSVTGESPQIEGWELIAIIEHLDSGNVIFLLPGNEDVKLPHSYRTDEPICQHCNLGRNRKQTYVIREKTGQDSVLVLTKLMRVGSDCLKDFTGHTNPDAIARWYTLLTDTLSDAESEDYWTGGTGGDYLGLAAYLEVVSAIIEERGWVSRSKAEESHLTSSADLALDPQFEIGADEDNAEEADLTIAWVRNELASKEDLSDYEHNLVTIFGTDDNTGNHFHTKHAGFVASALNAYQRHLTDKALAENGTSEYQGKIGERLDLVLTVKKRLEYQGFHHLDTLHITIMEDEDGNVYVWKTSAKSLDEGETYKVRGTIKAHNEYKEIKQTILTRCAISCPKCDGKIEVFYSVWAGGSIETCEKCYNETIEEIKTRSAEEAE